MMAELLAAAALLRARRGARRGPALEGAPELLDLGREPTVRHDTAPDEGPRADEECQDHVNTLSRFASVTADRIGPAADCKLGR